MIAAGQFIILSGMAMVFYQGGFSLTTDPLSALGFTRVAGESNILSCLLFNTSMLVVGLSVILLLPTMHSFFREDPIANFFSSASSVFAIFSGIAMCGAALTPGDINFEAHVAFAPFTFLFGLLMFSFAILPFLKTPYFSPRYALMLVVYTIFVCLTLVTLYLGSAADTLEGSIIQIVTQKLAIYTEVGVIFTLSYGAWKVQKTM
jgi:hypothetical protein